MGELLSALVLIAVCVVVGVRLVLLFGRTRGLPELLIGVAFLLASLLGVGCELVGALAPLSQAARAMLADVASIGMHAGIACIAAFTWRVFRPADAAGRSVFGAFLFALLTSLLNELALHHAAVASSAVRVVFSLGVHASVYLWSGYESGSYWLKLRRQLRIGLGDRLVTGQMLCWTIGSLSIAIAWLRIALTTILVPDHTEIGSVFSTFAVLICAGAYWMAFFPPARYRRWVAAA